MTNIFIGIAFTGCDGSYFLAMQAIDFPKMKDRSTVLSDALLAPHSRSPVPLILKMSELFDFLQEIHSFNNRDPCQMILLPCLNICISFSIDKSKVSG